MAACPAGRMLALFLGTSCVGLATRHACRAGSTTHSFRAASQHRPWAQVLPEPTNTTATGGIALAIFNSTALFILELFDFPDLTYAHLHYVSGRQLQPSSTVRVPVPANARQK